jgi:coenzyme F420-dependent glucose-6-phosphate dehydrogenase
VPIGTAVTPPGPRYHPVLIAQAWATLETMFPGRPFLGFGSGESLNESTLGVEWPSVGEQVDRMEEALEIIHALFDGERLTGRGHFGTDGAYLHTNPGRRPPIYVSAFGPKAAAVAGRWGDGLWTLPDPDSTGEVIDAYRSAAEDAGREPGEIVIQAQFSWAQSEEEALEGARVWKGAQPDEFYTDDFHDPREMYERGEQKVSDDDLKQALLIGPDPEHHVERIRQIAGMGATTIALMNVSGADPHGAIGFYGEEVLPAARAAVGA